jgi:hypothetical protein
LKPTSRCRTSAPALFLPFTLDFRRTLAGIHRRQLGLNAHLRQLLLGELQHFLRGTVVMRRPQRGAETVRETGLFQQLAGFRRIVRPRLKAFGIGNRRRYDAGGRCRIAGERHFDQRLAVDGVVDRFAYFRVIERFCVTFMLM